jgi:hypothetical protein
MIIEGYMTVEPVYVLGAHKTATTSVVTMLNCHPKILCLYEVNLNNSFITKYGRQLLDIDPDFRPFFGELGDENINYKNLKEYLWGKGHDYIYIADKIPSTSTKYFEKSENKKCIVCIRDIRTWIAKKTVNDIYRVEHDIVPAAVDYLRFFIKSFLPPRNKVLHIKLEEIVRINSCVPKKTAEFLKVEFNENMKSWWQGIEEQMQRDVYKKKR